MNIKSINTICFCLLWLNVSDFPRLRRNCITTNMFSVEIKSWLKVARKAKNLNDLSAAIPKGQILKVVEFQQLLQEKAPLLQEAARSLMNCKLVFCLYFYFFLIFKFSEAHEYKPKGYSTFNTQLGEDPVTAIRTLKSRLREMSISCATKDRLVKVKMILKCFQRLLF